MQYMICNYVARTDFATAGPSDTDADGPAWGAYTKAMIEAGVLVDGNALHPSHTARTLRIRDGRRELVDGPTRTPKNQLGGYYIIDVPDLDAALEWAARNPAAARGAVEVRPAVAR